MAQFDELLLGCNISASGLSAERTRMEVVAGNIANAYATRTANGGPYRRQEVLFETVLRDQQRFGGVGVPFLGVQVAGVHEDMTDGPQLFQPGHPDANPQGYVQMPNVSLPVEMVNLMTASRAYEANLKVLQMIRKQMEQAIAMLKY